MTFEQTADLALEAIKFAGTLNFLAAIVGGLVDPLLDGLEIEVEFARDLGSLEPLDVVELAQPAEGLEIDHRAPLCNTARRMSLALLA